MERMNNSFTRKVGKTTVIVNVMQAETANKSLDDKFRELCIHAALESGQEEPAAGTEPEEGGDLRAVC